MQNDVPIFARHNNLQQWTSVPNGHPAITIPVKSLIMHPGGNGVRAVLTFLVPPKLGGGSYQSASFRAQITDIDPNGGDGVTRSIEHNGVLLPGATGTLFSPVGGPLATTPLTYTIPVTTNDTINVVVDANANENFDSTAITGLIDLN
ncbi:MAG: hypothetical protein ABI306_02985 [Caulobacteraceae bacterium]